MRKVFLVFLGMLAAAGVAGSVYFYMNYKKVSAERETLLQQTAQLQQSIDAIGPITTAYTVKGSVTTGDKIKADDLMEISIPQAVVTTATVTDPEAVVGKLYKVDLNTGTPVTTDVVMDEEFADTIYEQDMSFRYIPLGLSVGDYVDVRITFPYGETFLAISHKRVCQVVPDTNTVKLRLTPAEQAIWQSVLRDTAQYANEGCTAYLTKYVEPGIQDSTIAYYPVRKEMEPVETLNPNIDNKRLVINSNLRTQMDTMLANVSAETGGKMSVGVTGEASSMNSARDIYSPDKSNQSNAVVDPNSVPTTTVGDGSISDIQLTNPEEAGTDNPDMQKADADGNTSSVTGDQQAAADGGPLFSGEEPIQ